MNKGKTMIVWTTLLALCFSHLAIAQDSNLQTPPEILAQAAGIQDRFVTVLDEECPDSKCFSVGCRVSRFQTLDEKQTSSLPGLEENASPGKAQYRLSSVICEFTHEPSLVEASLKILKQRLKQKVRRVGVTVMIRSRALESRSSLDSPAVDPEENKRPLTLLERFTRELFPFIPWILLILTSTLAGLAFLWGWRRLGKDKPKSKLSKGSKNRGAGVGSEETRIALAEPSANMIITRIGQMRDELINDNKLLELALKKNFEGENYDELCLVLRHFGPELLGPLREKTEYRSVLAALSKAYEDQDFNKDTALGTWAFLDRLERSITSARVRIDSQPLEDEFSFLESLEVDELIGILREVTEPEALAAVSHAPARLREKFFAAANPTFTAKFVEHLTKVEKMPDHFVRETARKLRAIYGEKGEGLRTIEVDRIPLLEQALNSLEPERRKALVAELGRANPGTMKALAPAIFLDDSLPYLSDDVVTEAFLTVTPQEAGHYLASFEWGKTIVDRLNPRLQSSIGPYINHNKVNPALVNSARRKIGVFVKDQDNRGNIDLRTINTQLIGKT